MPTLLRIKTYLPFATMFAVILPARVNSQSPESTSEAQAPLPTAKEIVDRYQAAIGGVSAWMALATTTATYERQVDNDPTISTIKLYAKAPDKRLDVLTLPDGSERRYGCDGKSIWTVDARGFREHTGGELIVSLRHCDFYARLHLIKSPDKAKVSGIEAVAGRNAYVVEYSPDEYSKGRYYFDCENGLLVRQDETESLPEGQLVQQDFPEDYRTVDGVKIQFRNRDILNGHTLLLRLTQINHNVPVDDALFVKPAK